MVVDKVFCNVCGKEFNLCDRQEDFGIHTGIIGYGSKYDGEAISLDMCCDCFDRVMEDLIPRCKINPRKDRDL